MIEMQVKITGFNEDAEIPFIDYEVFGLNLKQMEFLNDNLADDTSVEGDIFKIRVFFADVFPFQSDIAKIKIDDFVAREEMEMNLFLSSFLEDI